MGYLEELKKHPEAFEYYAGAENEDILFAEKQLGVVFPSNYRQFLTECGMCNYGDTRIDGIFKTENKTYYPIVDNTISMRRATEFPNDLLVLDFEEQEYLTLYKVSKNIENKDGFIYGAEVNYDESGKMKIGKLEKLFDSFEQYFENFIELGNC